MNSLLNAPYPFNHKHHKRMYEKSDKFSNVYHCNICHVKLLGDKELTEHNRCLLHQMNIQNLFSQILEKSTNDRYLQFHLAHLLILYWGDIVMIVIVLAYDLGQCQASQWPNQAEWQKKCYEIQQSLYRK